MKHYAIATNGSLNMGSDYSRESFKIFLKNHEGTRIEFVPFTPESKNLRGFFEGAVVPLYTFFQEGYSHRNYRDNETVREWLKSEYNGEFITLSGKAQRVVKSTKGVLKEFIERVIDGMGEQGYPIELLNPNEYKKWKNEIFPYGGQDNYIDYLVEIGKLKI